MDITWNSAYIWDLYVLKEYRNMGIGTALIKNTLVYLKSLGFNKVGLLVNYWNENARKLFEKLGFKLWSHFLVKRL
ncbi:MAG: GNAT family N-acetyltransferase [Candidatus Bathycorpusculaceae bacterium]